MLSKIKKNKKRNIYAILIIITLLILMFANSNDEKSEGNKNIMQYNKFINILNKNQVKEITYNRSNFYFTATLKDENSTTFRVENPQTEDFKKFILEKGIKVNPGETNTSTSDVVISLLSIILPLLFIYFIFRRMSPKKNNSIDIGDKSKNSTNLKFSDVGGHNETKKDLQPIIDFLKNPKKYEDFGAKLPKGVILYGPPGTGKTLLAKALAGESGVNFVNVNASEFVEMYVGVGAARVRDLFKKAKEMAPCIIFIDELEALARNSSMENSEKEQTLKQFLVELDGFEENKGIIVIGATNDLNSLNETFIRSGRFDRHIAVNLPDHNERLELINLYIKNKKISKLIDFENLSKQTMGMSGADISKILNEAAIVSVTKNKEEIDEEDIEDAFYKSVMKGYKKEKFKRDEKEMKIVAYHEAGHTIATKLLTENSVSKVTIIPSTSGAGGVTFINNNGKTNSLVSKKDILNEIKVLYAGRAAEEIFFGNSEDVTTGASNDIQVATKKMLGYIKIFGMSNYGLINLNYLEKLSDEKILKELTELSNKLYSEVLQFLKEREELLNELSSVLMIKESIEEKEIEEIIKKYR